MKTIKAVVSGKVQGVGYRMSTRDRAKQLNVRGYVQNLNDGNVVIVARGEVASVNSLIKWARSGPSSAVVNNLEIEFLSDNLEEFEDFTIRR
jgi:acylphosphatase